MVGFKKIFYEGDDPMKLRDPYEGMIFEKCLSLKDDNVMLYLRGHAALRGKSIMAVAKKGNLKANNNSKTARFGCSDPACGYFISLTRYIPGDILTPW